ncbi:SIMPL domain-containing protein [Fertoebacter nigrum]|uniref:SIMPL domain-containing protein n=1 Tax=Fertoeibacter niger TaxID=2656921 RepID=A0A8X8KNH0_9RHOB|nr:SIMPL domain-containing protein [Fertoeibacter niger]NUB44025.1 SIMPL domain-containing protein [Fertoeibacter niger]
MRILTALALATAIALPFAAMAQEVQSPRITVTGEGRVDARPDMATITLGVMTEAATAAEAMAANSAELAKVLERLRAAGIADRDLQTTGLSLNANWQSTRDNAPPVITGYIAQNMLTVRVRALDTLGGVLDAAVQDGANTLNGVGFGLTDPDPAMDEARKRAVADAVAKATLLTGAAGVGLGPIIEITEGGGYAPPMPQFRMEAGMAADAVPVAEGEVTMTAQVTVIFALEQ